MTERPGLDLHLTCGDECAEIKQFESRFDQTVTTGLLQTDVLQEHLPLFIRVQLGNISLSLGSNDENLGMLFRYNLLYSFHIGVSSNGTALVNVADIQDGLGGQQEQIVGHGLFFFAFKLHCTCRLALLKNFLISFQNIVFYLCLWVAAHLGNFLNLVQTVLDCLQILNLQFGVNNLFVTDRVHAAIHMGYVVIIEASKDMNDGVCLTDVA